MCTVLLSARSRSCVHCNCLEWSTPPGMPRHLQLYSMLSFRPLTGPIKQWNCGPTANTFFASISVEVPPDGKARSFLLQAHLSLSTAACAHFRGSRCMDQQGLQLLSCSCSVEIADLHKWS